MKVAVWDTYVTKKNGIVMHFDILVPEELKDEESVFAFGREYLKSKGQEGQALASKECSFYHVETLKPHWEADIKSKGYTIIEMENC